MKIKKINRDFDIIEFEALENDKRIGHILGYTSGNQGYLRKVYVKPEYHNQGIGTKLIKKFENAARLDSNEIVLKAIDQRIFHKLGYIENKAYTEENNINLIKKLDNY